MFREGKNLGDQRDEKIRQRGKGWREAEKIDIDGLKGDAKPKGLKMRRWKTDPLTMALSHFFSYTVRYF